MSGTQAKQLTKSQIATDSVRHHATATGTDRFVLLTFAFYVNNDTGLTWPSVDPTVMHETGMSRRAVFRAIKNLTESGELKVVRRRHNQPTLYRVGPQTSDIDGTSVDETSDADGTSVGERSAKSVERSANVRHATSKDL